MYCGRRVMMREAVASQTSILISRLYVTFGYSVRFTVMDDRHQDVTDEPKPQRHNLFL